jgi:hypothetical protein
VSTDGTCHGAHGAELEARKTAAAAILADYQRELREAPLTKPPGREWMLRLADALGSQLAALGPDRQS